VQNYASLDAEEGTTNLNQPLGTGFSTVTASATVNIATSQTLAALEIGAGGLVRIGAAGPAPAPGDELAGAPALAVPEPGLSSLLLSGVLGIFCRRRARHL
jgi:hypothetical protein